MANLKLREKVTHEPVADLAALKAIDTTPTSNGVTVIMADLSYSYVYSATSTATPDDDLVVQPTVGTGRWLRNEADNLWSDDGTDAKLDNASLNVDLQDGGLKDTNVTTAVKLGSATDTSLNTTKKDLLGGVNEVNTAVGTKANDADVLKKDGSVALTAAWDAGSFKITAETLESDIATGTAPLTVASTTVVTNLNADLLDGNQASAFPLDSEVLKKDGSVALTADWDAGSQKITAETLESDVATGTAPLTIASTTKVTNLNADLVDGLEGSSFAQDSTVLKKDGTVALTADWDAGSFKVTAETLESDVTTGTPPLVVASTTAVTNLNADLLDGVEGAAYTKVDGSVPFSGTVGGITPVASSDLATKEYVDTNTGLQINYFFSDTLSDIGGIYYDSFDTETGAGESTLVKSSLAIADDQPLYNYATLANEPGITTLSAGIYNVHIHAERTSGSRVVNLYWELYTRVSGGAETLRTTSEISGPITSKTGLTLHATIPSNVAINSTDRIIVKVYANVSGGGADVDVTLYQEGETDSNIGVPTTSAILSDIFLRQDGTKALQNNWDAGSFKITAETLESDVVTGTPPLVVASTTKVTNLNADLIDGLEASSFAQDSTVLKKDGSVALTSAWDAGSFKITAETLESDVATGTAPLTIASTTVVANLNVDSVDGYDFNQALQTSDAPSFAGLSLTGDVATVISMATTKTLDFVDENDDKVLYSGLTTKSKTAQIAGSGIGYYSGDTTVAAFSGYHNFYTADNANNWQVVASIDGASTLHISSIKANSSNGLSLVEDGGKGIFIKDGSGYVGIGTNTQDGPLSVVGDTTGGVKIHLGNLDAEGFNVIRFSEAATGNGSGYIHRFSSGWSGADAYAPNTMNMTESVGKVSISGKTGIEFYIGGVGSGDFVGTFDTSGNLTLSEAAASVGTNKVKATTSAGLSLQEDGGLGIKIADSTGNATFDGSVKIASTKDLGFEGGDEDKILFLNSTNQSKVAHSTGWSLDFYAGNTSTTNSGKYAWKTVNSGGSFVDAMTLSNTGVLAVNEVDIVGKLATNSTTQATVVAGTGILNNSSYIRVAGSSGAVTVTATPSIAAGTYDGQRMVVMGVNDTNTVTLQDETTLGGSTLELAGDASVVLGLYDTIEFIWDLTLTKWVELTRSNN